MLKQKNCIDFYGEKLKVGDEVIPILSEALIIGIGGVITKIEYSEKYNNHYITISDKSGNVLLKGVDARCYTTQDRYDERNNQDYVYDLTFYNERFWQITSIPLTNRTNVNYEIPDETCFAVIGARHLHEKGKQLTNNSWSGCTYIHSNIYYLLIKNGVKICCRKRKKDYYLENSETYQYYPISSSNKIFNNIEELKKYVKCIIEYFNSADLTYVNNNEEFSKNENAQEFEKKLIRHLND